MGGILLGSRARELSDVQSAERCVLVGFGSQGTDGSGDGAGGFHDDDPLFASRQVCRLANISSH